MRGSGWSLLSLVFIIEILELCHGLLDYLCSNERRTDLYPVTVLSANWLLLASSELVAELCGGDAAALSPRQGTKREDSNPPGWRPKPGAIGDCVAAHPAAPCPRQAFFITMRSQADWLIVTVQAVPATKMQ